jgi:hypothetical protein
MFTNDIYRWVAIRLLVRLAVGAALAGGLVWLLHRI